MIKEDHQVSHSDSAIYQLCDLKQVTSLNAVFPSIKEGIIVTLA